MIMVVFLKANDWIKVPRQAAQAKNPPAIKNAKWYERVTSNIHATESRKKRLVFWFEIRELLVIFTRILIVVAPLILEKRENSFELSSINKVSLV